LCHYKTTLPAFTGGYWHKRIDGATAVEPEDGVLFNLPKNVPYTSCANRSRVLSPNFEVDTFGMNVKQFGLGTLAGAVATFATAVLIYGFVLRGFMFAHTLDSVPKEPTNFAWLSLTYLSFGAILTYVFLKWGTVRTALAGLGHGLIIGLLVRFAINAAIYATSHIYENVTIVIVDAVAGGLVWGVGGAAVGWVLGLTNRGLR
jgi:hypothetical protein